MKLARTIAILAVLLNLAARDSHSQVDSRPATRADRISLDVVYERLAAQRRTNLVRLRKYAAEGKFPLNSDFTDQLVPYFVDELGTACAVGHLMRLDDHGQLVEAISLEANHVQIEDVRKGPLVEWILKSGLTQEECALIQPSYADLGSYRRNRNWHDEIARLRKHFEEVEERLLEQTDRSLRKALLRQIDDQITKSPNDPGLAIEALTDSLKSKHNNVRIAAAYAIAKQVALGRDGQLNALLPLLDDPDLTVRFWAASAIEKVIATELRFQFSATSLHYRTLSVFLDVFHKSEQELRLPALIQLANVAPTTMSTHVQLRCMPEIRRIMVAACEDADADIRQFARRHLSSWRWQRVVYESHRMRRQYLAGSVGLESLAAETLALRRRAAEPLDNLLASDGDWTGQKYGHFIPTQRGQVPKIVNIDPGVRS